MIILVSLLYIVNNRIKSNKNKIDSGQKLENVKRGKPTSKDFIYLYMCWFFDPLALFTFVCYYVGVSIRFKVTHVT